MVEFAQLLLGGQIEDAHAAIIAAREDARLIAREVRAVDRRALVFLEMTKLRSCLEIEDAHDAVLRTRAHQTTV